MNKIWVEDWDQHYMTEAYNKAMKSKDGSTKIGAVIVGPDNEPVSNGYNNFPRGVDDDVKERHCRPLKYQFTEHAERNAIYNAARHGVALKGTRLYVPQRPCTDCARGIIQSGIIEVIYHKEWPGNTSDTKWLGAAWFEDQEVAMIMFDETGVKVREWSGKILPLRILFGEQEYTVDALI